MTFETATLKTFQDASVYNLQETSMIAGTYRELYFYVYSSGSIPLDVRGSAASWLLTPLDQPDYIALEKEGECFNGYILIKLLTEDTISLTGKFVQKPLISGALGYDYRLEQGIFTIIPALGGDDAY